MFKWAEDAPEGDVIAFYQAMWNSERDGLMAAERTCASVRETLLRRFPLFAAAPNAAVAEPTEETLPGLGEVVRRAELAAIACGWT